MPETGHFTAYLPGMTPDHVRSTVGLCDDQWHHVAMTLEPGRVRLFVDGKQVADQAMKFNDGTIVAGGLAIGSLFGQEIGCDGLIDEVRISSTLREIKDVPTKPYEADEHTIGLWHFDALDAEKRFPDASKLKSPAGAADDVIKKKFHLPLKSRITLGQTRSDSNGPKRTRVTTAGG